MEQHIEDDSAEEPEAAEAQDEVAEKDDSGDEPETEDAQEATEEEEDMLDLAPGLTPTSRLASQAVPDGSCDIVVEIPGWNRNHAKEPAH